MARRPTNPERGSNPGVADDGNAEVGSAPVRRAPYSDNPEVGTRGLRTQQRILEAALQVFGELGYERATLDKIGKLAGCSRVSIYQYFAGKDDVFRHLAGQVARQMRASAEALEPMTPDAEGWAALRAWVSRYADIFARYEPVFRAFSAAAESDAALADDSTRAGARNLAMFQSKLSTTTLPPRQLDPLIELLLTGVTRSLDIASILRTASPDTYSRERVEVALTDVLHRALFGSHPTVNVHGPPESGPPGLRIGQALGDVFAHVAELEAEASRPGRRALASLLEVGHDVIVRRGYHGTRVDDVVAAAGVSHGAFYRYFENKDELVRVVAVQALQAVSGTLADVPDATDRAALRRWLRRYNTVHLANGAMIRVWVQTVDDLLRDDRAAVFDWGRQQMVPLLSHRELGDADVDAVILLSVVEAFGSSPRKAIEVDAMVHVIEQGFLGPGTND